MAAAETDVRVGPLEAGLGAIAELAGGRRVPLVSDPTVWALHGRRLADIALDPPILVPPGESAKSWEVLAAIVDSLSALGVERGTPVIALGGGSVGDVAGLAAALYKRGCPIVHVPTTLLAQADSAIGGKTAIDSGGIKNLAGLFHPPALVLADPDLVDTLDRRQLAAGYAEVVKYGLIDDPVFFAWCESNGRALLSGDRSARDFAVRNAVRSKLRLVRDDPLDRGGTRTLLNLGHSFAHAIESEAGLGALLHGEAVAIGLVLAFRFSAFLRLAPPADAERIAAHLADAGLPTRLGDVGLRGRALLRWIDQDKKNRAGGLTLVLAHGIGRAFVMRAADRAALVQFLAAA